MRRTALLLIAALVFVACGDDDTDDTTTTSTTGGEAGVVVNVANFQFNPSSSEVAVGEPVTFVFRTGTHTATATDRTWDSGALGQGSEFEVVFNETGTFEYICNIHTQQMSGTITVTG